MQPGEVEELTVAVTLGARVMLVRRPEHPLAQHVDPGEEPAARRPLAVEQHHVADAAVPQRGCGRQGGRASPDDDDIGRARQPGRGGLLGGGDGDGAPPPVAGGIAKPRFWYESCHTDVS